MFRPPASTVEVCRGEIFHGPSYDSEVVVDQPQLSDTQLETAVSWEELPWRRARLMVVGEGRAGKTSLLRSLRGEPFMDTPSTQGLEMSGCLLDRDDVVNSDWSPAGEGATEYARAVGAKLCTEPPSMTTAPPQHAAARNASDTGEGTPASIDPRAATDSSAEAPADEPPSHERSERAMRETSAGRGAGRMRCLDKGLVASCMRDGVHQQVVISVWDYAGQELFDALHQLFLSQQGVYLLVFSMRALQDDEESVLQRLRFWLGSLRLHARSAPLLLVGTHGDQVQDPEARRQLSSLLRARLKPWRGQENTKAGKNQGLSFFPVDNTLSGGAGAADPEVADLRAQINDMIVGHRWEEKDQRFIDYPVPVPYLEVCDRLCGLQAKLAARVWLQRVEERAQLGRHGATEAEFLEAMSVVRQLAADLEVPQDAREELLAAAARHAGREARLSAYSGGAAAAAAAAGGGAEPRAARHAVATLEDVAQLARECGLGQGRAASGALTEEVRTMLKLFHRLGVVLYFDEIPALQGLVILDPQWLIDVVCAVARDFDVLHPRRCDDRLTHHPELQDAWQRLKERGVLHSGLLEILWSLEGGVDPAPAGPEVRAGLLALLQHFGLLCKLNAGDGPRHGAHGAGCCGQYLVPCLLPENGEEEEEAPPLVPGARLDIDFPSGILPQPFFQQLVVYAIQRGREFEGGSRDPLQGVRRHRAELSFGDRMELQISCPVGARRIHVSVRTEEAGACAAVLKEVEVLVEGLNMRLYHGALFSYPALGAPAVQGTPLCSGVAEHILLQRRNAAPEDMRQEVSLAALRRSAARSGATSVKRFSDYGNVEAVHFEHWQLRHALPVEDGEAGGEGGDEAGDPASESRRCRGLPGDCRYHFFVAHKFTTGGDQVAVLCAALERAGWKPWYYNYLSETTVTEELMQKGVQMSHCVVLFLSREVFSSEPVLLELREARRCGKRVLLVHEAELDHARVDPDEMQRETPEDLRDLLWGGGLGSIPFQRHRSTGLASLVSSLVRHAGLHATGTAPQDAARTAPGTPQDASTTTMAALAAAAALLPTRAAMAALARVATAAAAGSIARPLQPPLPRAVHPTRDSGPLHDQPSADATPEALSQAVQGRPPGGFIQLPRSELGRGIFVSHSRRDPAPLNAVYALVHALRFDRKADGEPMCRAVHSGAYELWIDKEQMEKAAGEKWEEILREAQKKCALTLVFLGNAYCASEQCTLELEFSLFKNRKVVPVFLERFAQSAEEFAAWKEVSGTKCDPDRAQFDKWETTKDVLALKVQGKQGLPIELALENFSCHKCRRTRDKKCSDCADSTKAALRNPDNTFLHAAEALGRMIDKAVLPSHPRPRM
ncbi:hypothetical protein CYMTET_54068 [Cymbomonas tetramitiformis]|uniref:non-specific serine/threonine protein kinase n=1 Tax=Cymbomonas tetramitiformis TaxID=36881 RepID=A0AAE0EPZ1_9CHLO|nr:hypothetical protein CYMTET_54068 [Cymbomonas tetramitiformis]